MRLGGNGAYEPRIGHPVGVAPGWSERGGLRSRGASMGGRQGVDPDAEPDSG
jgi:hypothetical protein